MAGRGTSTWRLLLLYTGVTLAGIGGGLARPGLAFHVKYGLHGSTLAAAGLTTGFMAGRGLASLASGAIGEWRPGLRWLIVLLGLGGVGLMLLAAAPRLRSPGEALALVGLWGLAAGLVWPTVQVVTSQLARRGSGAALSLYFALGGLGVSTGNWLFGRLPVSPAGSVALGGALVAAGSPLLALAARGAPAHGGRGGLGEAARRLLDPVLLWVVASALALGVLSGTLREYFYIYAHEALGLSRQRLGDLLLAGGVAGTLTGLLLGPLSDRLGAPRVLSWALLAAGTGGLLLALPGAAVAGLGYVLANAGVRGSLPLTRNASLAGPRGGSLLVGASNTASSAGMALGPLVAGLLYEKGRGALVFAGSGVLVLAVLALYPFIAGRARSARPGA